MEKLQVITCSLYFSSKELANLRADSLKQEGYKTKVVKTGGIFEVCVDQRYKINNENEKLKDAIAKHDSRVEQLKADYELQLNKLEMENKRDLECLYKNNQILSDLPVLKV